MTDPMLPSDDDQEQREAAEFVLRLGHAWLQAGYPVDQVVDGLQALAEYLALPQAQIYVTPVALQVTVGPFTHQHTALRIATPGRVNLGHLTRLDDLVKAVLAGTLRPKDGIARLDALAAARAPYSAPVTLLAYALASAAFACVLGGGPGELVVAALIGAVTGLLALGAERLRRLERIFQPLAAFLASFLASALAGHLLPLQSDLVTLAGLVVLLPGFTLTVALQELATRNLISGTVHLTATLSAFLGIILGVALGNQLAVHWLGVSRLTPPAALPEWTTVLAVIVAGFTYTVTLRAERRDTGWVVLGCLLAGLTIRLGTPLLGPQFGAFSSALVVSLASNFLAVWRNRPAALMLVPGILLLVPGSIGFESVEALLHAQTVQGIQIAFQTFITAIGIVYGVFCANLLLPPRGFLTALGRTYRRVLQEVRDRTSAHRQ